MLKYKLIVYILRDLDYFTRDNDEKIRMLNYKIILVKLLRVTK